MSYEWGRAQEAGKWQRAMPVWFMGVILLALASGIGVWWVRQTFVWTPLQRSYLSAYTRSAMASSLAIQSGRYRLLLMNNRRGNRLAIDEEVVPISSPTGDATFALSQLAQRASSGHLVWRDLVVNHARLHADLQVWSYRNQTLTDLARPSLITVFVVLVAGLLVAIPKDVQWSRSRRHGRRLKGPELMSVGQFNRRTRPMASRSLKQHACRASCWHPAGAGNSAHDRVEPSADHGRLRHRQVGVDPTGSPAARGPWRHSDRVRPSPRIHAAVLHARAR